MAAQVSFPVQVFSTCNEEQVKTESHVAGNVLITRDLLGSCSSHLGSKDLDLYLQVPCGWENHLDTKDLNLNYPPSSSTTEEQRDLNKNFPEENLDLKLVRPLPSFESVCTLEKVKFALQRAERESSKRIFDFTESSSTISSAIKERSSFPGLLFTAACPSCLIYVLISRTNPKCPRCDSLVPSPAPKKPRLDLNTAL